jgi:anti-anti-sigma factor
VPDFFRFETQQSVHVLDLLLPELIDAMEFDRLNESLSQLLEGKTAQRWVLDLSSTGYLGSAMLGLIVNLRQQIKSGGGKLIVCGMSPRLTEIFHTCSMERLFTIVKTKPDAIKTLSK